MSEHSYVELEHITQKYLKNGLPFFDTNAMKPGWYRFYEPDDNLCDSIPPFATRGYHLRENTALPINFIILNNKTVSVGASAFEEQKDLLLFDAKSSDGLKIQENAFKKCSNLYKIRLPYEIDFIDKTAFCGCYKLSIIEITRGELDGKKLENKQRNTYIPLKYNVVMIGDCPYIYDEKESKKENIYKVKKLAVSDGKFQDELLCKQTILYFDDILGYPSLRISGLGHTEQKADENLKIEIETITSAVNKLKRSKTFSLELIGIAITSLNTR